MGVDKEKRYKWAKIILVSVFIVLVVRLWYLQIIKGEEMRKLSEQNRIRIQKIYAPRGVIYDRKGRILADTRPSFNVYIIPEDIRDFNQTVDGLAKILNIDREEIVGKLRSAKDMPPSFPVKIKSDLTTDEVARVEAHKIYMPGVTIYVEPRRYYPYGELFAHLIGYVSEISKDELKAYKDYSPGDYIGKYGLEKMYEQYLRGKDGERRIEVDAMGREIRVLETVEPTPGNNLYLNVDLDIQMAIDRILGTRSGGAVVLDVKTGGVIALVSKPAFDPNLIVSGIPGQEWTRLSLDKKHPLQNRVIQGRYPPGSTFKLLVALAGLEEGLINERTSFLCKGGILFGNRFFRCWKEKGHGVVSLHRAIVESCDVFFYNLGLKLGVDNIHRMSEIFGLTDIQGIDLPGEKKGFVPSTEWKYRTFKEKWYEGETLSVSIGQGAVWLTPLGLATLTAIIANNGVLYKPQIVSKIVSPDGKILKLFKPEERRKVKINPENLTLVKKAMWGVVNEPGGTAFASRTNVCDMSGKTGTAQTASSPRASKGDHAWFVAFAPYLDPQVAISVIVEYGGHGATSAAPIAKIILEEYFKEREKIREARTHDR
ncbi:MAG: penicillin-binding protein 2 [Desulfobacterota bacterium]|nr:penicillin-binding protein 2 [Thermodesulfobacteriota bacterium]MDW8002807.1 penicillin-binding protein 2 [Deltaproteobacteria bacterium]